MINERYKTLIPALATALLLGLTIFGCKNPPAGSAKQVPAVPAGRHLENGAYLVLREAPTEQEARAAAASHVVLAYDRKKYSVAPPNEPLTYVAIDPKDYVPLIIEGTPELKSDGQGQSILTVCLTRRSAERAEAFTRAHLGGRIAMVVDGEIVTLHKIRSVITGGRVQITRCADNACEVLRSKLVN